MATTTVSIGSNQNIDTETPASTVTSSDPNYTITFSSNPNSTVAVGDIIEVLADVGSDNTPSSSSGSDPYTVSFSNSVNSAVGIGARFYITDPTSGDTYRYDVTNVSGSNYTLDYISGASSAAAPTDIVDEYGDQVDGRFYAVNTYLLTEIDGNNYKFKYCTGVSSASPFGLQTNGSQSTATFKRAFSTITLFEAMVDDASPSYWGGSDDVVGECHADSTFTDNDVNFNSKQSLSSVKLTVNSDDRHNGTAESGVLIKPTSRGTHGHGIIKVQIDDMTIEWLDISLASVPNRSGGTYSQNRGIFITGNNIDDLIIRNNLIHDCVGDKGNQGPVGISSNTNGGTGNTWSFLNNIIYNLVEGSDDSTSAINCRKYKGTFYIYNNTIYKITAHGGSKDAIGIRVGYHSGMTYLYIKNNIVAGLSASDEQFAYDIESAVSNKSVGNNLSDDTSDASNNALTMGRGYTSGDNPNALVGKTLSEIDFNEDDVSASVDLHIGESSVCLEAGEDLGTTNGVNIDIDGLDRDATGVTWDIGADQKSTVDVEAGAAFFLFIN